MLTVPGFIIPCPVSELDNCSVFFYFVINARISHVITTLIRYFLIPKSRDLVPHNPWISGLKNVPGSGIPWLQSPSGNRLKGVDSVKGRISPFYYRRPVAVNTVLALPNAACDHHCVLKETGLNFTYLFLLFFSWVSCVIRTVNEIVRAVICYLTSALYLLLTLKHDEVKVYAVIISLD